MWFSSGYDLNSQTSQFAVNVYTVITHDAEEAYQLTVFLHGATVSTGRVLLVVRLQVLAQVHHIR